MAVLRQLKDIQVQAERITSPSCLWEEVVSFSSYSKELKVYLLTHVEEEMILKYIKEIPDLNIEEIGRAATRKSFFTSLFSSWAGALYHERRKIKLAQEVVRDIRAKYASIEFLMKNYLG